MTYRKYYARKNFRRRHVAQISFWIILSLVLLHIITKLQQFSLMPKQLKTTVTFERSKGNTTGIVLSEDNSTKESTLLFIAVLTHWRRWKRRDSIRETWMTQCGNDRARCLFFTDDVGAKENDKRRLKTEISWNNDTILMPMTGNQFSAMSFTIKTHMNHSSTSAHTSSEKI